MTRTTIENTLFAWLAAAGVTATVIMVQQDGARPALPFMTINVRMHGQASGGAYTAYRDDDTVVSEGEARGVATVQAFGAAAVDQLDEAVARLPLAHVVELLGEAGLSVEPVGGLINLTGVVDTGHEPRAAIDLDLAYRRRTAALPFTPVETVQVEQVVSDIPSTTYDVSTT